MKCPKLSELFKLEVDKVLILLFAFSAFLVLSAFVMEYVFHAQPCKMCWQQRYVHWAIGSFAVVGLILPCGKVKKAAIAAVILSAVVGGYLAAYQSLGQLGLVELPASCTGGSGLTSNPADLFSALQNKQEIPDCRDWGITIFGMSIAMWNFFIMSGVIICLTKWYIINKK